MDVLLKDMNPVLQLLLTMAMFTLLPVVFMCMTSFLRFVIVFSMLKTAMGTNSVPPAMVLIGLCIIMTFYTMSPVFQKMYEAGSIPYKENGNIVMAVQAGSEP